jgi:hypothetical protein
MMDVEDAVEAIYTWADEALRAGRFADVDARLRDMSPPVLGVTLSLAWLSICSAAEPHMTELPSYRARVVAFVSVVAPERAEALLRGLA